jgi:parallel beta helix pectate lyase-like protein
VAGGLKLDRNIAAAATAIALVATLTAVLLTGCTYPIRDLLVSQADAISQIRTEGAVYVASGATGIGLGTQDDPLVSIQDGIDLAAQIVSSDDAISHLEVRVAGGTYPMPSTLTLHPVTSLRGGYTADWTHEPAGSPTVITGKADPLVAFAAGTDKQTVVEYLTIRVDPVGEATAIECNSVSPTIRRVEIDVRSAWETSTGVLLTSSRALLDSNRILFGSASGTSWGVAVISSEAVIRNNVVSGRAGSGTAIGVHVFGESDVAILNNTFFMPGGTIDTALFLSGSDARVENNIFAAASSSRGIAEYDAGVVFASLRNNEFYLTDDPILRRSDGSELTTIGEVESYVDAAASGNDSDTDPQFANTAEDDFHLGANSISGIDLSGEFTHDADGATRTAPWSVGALELD